MKRKHSCKWLLFLAAFLVLLLFWVASEHRLRPDIFIYITDGCGPAPDRPPSYHVLWLLTADGPTPAPWGRELRLGRPRKE